MNIGRMRFRVEHHQFTEAPDAYRQMQRSWSLVGTYWADITALTGRELTNAQQRVAQVSHRVTMRYQPIGPKDKLVIGSRELHVAWVNNVDERNRQTDAYCEEKLTPS